MTTSGGDGGRRVWTAVASLGVGAVLAGAAPLGGQAPAPWCPEPEARQFDFWIGEWDVANHNRPPDGERWYRTGDATNRVFAVVGGCGIVEHWRGFAFPSAGHVAGYSVRAWNPDDAVWELVLLWPMGGPLAFGTPRGRFRDGVGEFFNERTGPDGTGVVSRLRFDGIGPDAFRWSNGVSRDGGETWSSTWRMESRRRPPAASGLLNGPSMSTERCPGAGHRAFDRWLGEWTGVRVEAGGDGFPVVARLDRILDGCAVVGRTRAVDGSWEAYRVRAWEEASGRWVEYSLRSDRRGLRRLEAPAGVDPAVFTAVDAGADGLVRIRWIPAGGGVDQVEETAPSASGPWREVARVRLEARVGGSGG